MIRFNAVIGSPSLICVSRTVDDACRFRQRCGPPGAEPVAMRVSRSLIAEIEAEPAAWKVVRADLADGLVVEFRREMFTA
ncbi:MAG: hypothetical protein ACXU7X_10095 [Croceibacterium sp.]